MTPRTAVRFASLTVALVVASALAACGGGGDDNASGRATAVAGVPDGAAFINQKGLKFRPSSLTVVTGEKVYFKNSEAPLHTVNINGESESKNMKKDEIFEWSPPGPGEYKVTCTFHPQMRSTITVQ